MPEGVTLVTEVLAVAEMLTMAPLPEDVTLVVVPMPVPLMLTWLFAEPSALI